ncbi:hypothetical protein M409DRAFT_61389 [Zasmidium cellare ATCC 36951]|uniref:JmjC domain-containing protein n=1 Tax=Zasmidium cellare ATCC 36951 TaxID=1080233 RepID=A0A6A6BVD9_ZASCE|nr:uncharacterized protein M409DRAFT_61389 [Zasmidium cellare ATCC 36951]KAF2158731.1 hypothetical protein M409DRAFT_61389 [Zasmidium cellare ATCC 36951]
MSTRLIPSAAVSTFRDSSGLPVPPSASNSNTDELAPAGQRIIRKSSRTLSQRAASGEVGARLDSLSMDDVERALRKTQLPDTEVSLLSLLQKPETNQADVVKQILNHMADHAEEHALQMALVWRYAKEHEVWKSCTNPDWRTEDSFLDSLDGNQTVRLCIQFGTSTDVARRGKINIIRRNWGEDWYDHARQKDLFPPAERGAASLSKNMLRLIASVSSSVHLSQALEFLEHAIQDRTAIGSRKSLGWKAATTTYLMLCDVQLLIAHIEEHRPTSATKTPHKTQSAGSDEESLELISSKGISSLSSFESSMQLRSEATRSTTRARGKPRPPGKGRKAKSQTTDDIQQLRMLLQEEAARRSGERQPRSIASNNSDIQVTGQEGRSSETVTATTASQAGKRKTVEPLQLDNETSREKRARIRMDRRQSILDVPNPPLAGVDGNIITAIPRQGLPPNGRQDHSTATDTQVDRAQEENMDSHVVRDIAPPRDSRRQSSTNSPTAEFVESVANASAFARLEQATGPSEKQQDQPLDSDNTCASCAGNCLVCEIPSGFKELERRDLYLAAHRALELEAEAPNATVRKWIKPIRYASWSVGLLQGPGEVCLLSEKSFLSQMRGKGPLSRPIIIRDSFDDADEWSATRYADQLDMAFADLEVDVRWHQVPEPVREKVPKMSRLCRASPPTLLGNPPNMLNLPDLTGAIAPAFLRQDRFRMLDLLIERCKADSIKHLGKQLHLSPFDVGGSRRFNILGWPGAFSGAHVDSTGATWVRNLFGQKLWMFVPEDLMTPADWEELATDGDDWNPGNKARAVVLQPGDVFVMRPGLVHAVYTLGDSGPSLMIGGFFLDNYDLIHTLQTFYKIGKNQRSTNEPISYQFAHIIWSLERIIRRNSAPYFSTPEDLDVFTDLITKLRGLGCDCSECDEECMCARDGRRCTPLCLVHIFGDRRFTEKPGVAKSGTQP